MPEPGVPSDHRHGGPSDLPPTGQTADGWWEVGVRRTLPLDPTSAWTAVRELLHDDDAVRGVRSETTGRVVRVTYQPTGWPAPSTLQLRVLSARTGTTLAVHHEHLPDAETREVMRQHWTATLQRLRQRQAGKSRAESDQRTDAEGA